MLEVLEGGIQTTVQDYPGRVGYLDLGTYPAGPMDHFAFRVANLLVGNPQGAAALEVTAGGLKTKFHDRRAVAVTGADMQATLNGKPIPLWESLGVGPDDLLELKIVKGAGFRAYVAVSGALDVPEYMGSRSTFTVGGFGGFEGRSLEKGDRVSLNRAGAPDRMIGRRLRPSARPQYGSPWEIEAMRGPQADPDYMTAEDMEFFFTHAWKVDRNSNRMGVRLESHKWQWARTSGGTAGGHPSNILDNGYAVWTVNVCGDQPIILVADGPSLGGFICNATLIYASTWKVGQLVPGRDTIMFKEVTIEEATQRARDLDATISERSIDRGQQYGCENRYQCRHGRELRTVDPWPRHRSHALPQLGQHRVRLSRRRPARHANHGSSGQEARGRHRRARLLSGPHRLRAAPHGRLSPGAEGLRDLPGGGAPGLR